MSQIKHGRMIPSCVGGLPTYDDIETLLKGRERRPEKMYRAYEKFQKLSDESALPIRMKKRCESRVS